MPAVLNDRIIRSNNWASIEEGFENIPSRLGWRNDPIPSGQEFRKEKLFSGLTSLSAINILTFSEKVTVKHHCFFVSSKLSSIIEEIKRSEYILNLKGDWDEEGAEKVNENTWCSAVRFLINYSQYLLDSNIVIEAPEINPCRDGSIDLSWRTDNARLLINIQNKKDGEAVFYGDLYNGKGKMPIKGGVPFTGVQEHLVTWMKYLHRTPVFATATLLNF